MKLHQHQEALLKLLKRRGGDFRGLPLRTIGEKIGVIDRAQVIAHHLEQLENKGYIRRISHQERLYEVLDEPATEIAYIKLYSSTAQCGPDGFFGEDAVIDKVPVSTKTFGISNPDNYFLIRAKGDSMETQIHDGDLVLVRQQDNVDDGQIAVVVHEEMPKIKRILRVNDHYVLKSLNTKYDDQIVSGEDPSFKVCGFVKGILKIK